MNIIDYIPRGHDNAIHSSVLCSVLDISPRQVREAVSQAMLDGNVILNLQDGNGYFVPTESERGLVEQYIRQEEHRAKTNLAKLKAARNWNPLQEEFNG